MQEGTPKKVLKLHQDSSILEKMLVLQAHRTMGPVHARECQGAGKFHVVKTGRYSRMASVQGSVFGVRDSLGYSGCGFTARLCSLGWMGL